jgi:hypothetical protein
MSDPEPLVAPASTVYRTVQDTQRGPRTIPADLTELHRLQGLEYRIEPELYPMSREVAAASIAVSLRRIADALGPPAAERHVAAVPEMRYIRPSPRPQESASWSDEW